MKCTLCDRPARSHFLGPDGKATGVARCGEHGDWPLTARDFDGASLARFFVQRALERDVK